jgi:hypothetical protein
MTCYHEHTCTNGRGYRCEFDHDATVYLIAPDGERIPGGGSCAFHAERVITEYREKLGEEWTTENVCTCA